MNSAQGRSLFTIPLMKGKNEQMPIREVKIDLDSQWPSLFRKRVNTNYNSAPYYDFYASDLFSITEKRHHYLFDLNLELLQWCVHILRLDTEMKLTSKYIRSYPERWTDLRNRMSPLSKPKITDEQLTYEQVFAEKHGFISNLSIIDMIFCCGPESGSILSNSL